MRDFAYQSAAIANTEIRKVLRDPTELFSRVVQPVLWLAVFGQVFSQVRGIPTGALSYLDYMRRAFLPKASCSAPSFTASPLSGSETLASSTSCSSHRLTAAHW